MSTLLNNKLVGTSKIILNKEKSTILYVRETLDKEQREWLNDVFHTDLNPCGFTVGVRGWQPVVVSCVLACNHGWEVSECAISSHQCNHEFCSQVFLIVWIRNF
jgi:hypothetical protein